MSLTFTPGLPIITFNGKRVFSGKSKLIKLIKASNIPLVMGQYNFIGDEFNANEALALIRNF